MYQGKPRLKKITQVNHNNPTLNSVNMRGIFFEPGPPVFVRDQLLYNPGFKDSLQQTVEQQQKRLRQANTPKQSYSFDRQSSTNNIDYEPLRKRYSRNEVLDKITQIPVDNTFQSLNYKGYQTIKNKQMHGFNIISNF